MKRYLHFYYWLAAVVLMFCSTATVSAQVKVKSLSQLKAGSVIKIYPKYSYGRSSTALACSGDGQDLTSYGNAGSGDSWTLVDARDGYYYLKNNLGCYWAYQSKSSYQSLTCTTSQSSAVKVSLTWDSNYSGVCFWNQKDETGLNNLNGTGWQFNWWSSSSDYSSDTNTTFDVALISDEHGEYVSKEITDNGIKYLLESYGKTAEVLPNNYSGNIVIPSEVTYDGETYKVTSVGETCFKYCNNLISVSLPESITSLGDECFAYCSGLASIQLPDGITSLGNNCFEKCSSLVSVSLPKTTTSLGVACFSGCVSLTSINLPDGIVSLKNNCFADCGSLVSVSLSEKTSSLGVACFSGCVSLTSINLPDGIVSLGDYCFQDCRSLASIIIPKGVTSLGSFCFYFCSSLTSVTLPEGITSLGNHCFGSCKQLTSITLPNTITELKYSCFSNCTSLTNITLPEGITFIDGSCFESCKRLTTITLPATLKNVGDQIFQSIDKIAVLCLAIEPPKSNTGTIMGDNCRLFIPKECVDKYKSNSDWNGAYSINPLYPVESVSLVKECSVVKTKPTKLEYSILPENAGTKEVNWNSANSDIATVSTDGFVTGKKVGSVEITATAKDGTDIVASTTVKVLPLALESMAFSESQVSVTKTKKSTISLLPNPMEADGIKLVWTSSDESVATVEQSTNAEKPFDAIVTGHTIGKTIIKAEAQDGSGISATCEVEVAPLQVSDITSQTLSVVKTIPTEMMVTVTPAEADNKKLKWSSLTPEIASVTEDGIVTGLKMGTAKLKAVATDGSEVEKTFDVAVTGLPVSSISLPTEPISVTKTKTGTIVATIAPATSDNQKLTWSSDNTAIAVVDENGVVTGKKVGTATITAKTTDGSNLSASAKVVVQPLLVETMAFADPQVSVVKTKDKTITLTLNSAEVDNKKMVWTSSDNSIATVVQNLNASYPLEAIVAGQKVGKAIIKAEAQDGSGISATCEVEVTPLQVSDITSQTLSVVKTIPTEMVATVTPVEADNKKLKWSSLTPEVASVTEDGVVTGLKMGTAKLKAFATDGSNVERTFDVAVVGLPISSVTLPSEPVTVTKTKTEKIVATIAPIASDNQKLTWSSSNTAIAVVDENGVVTGKKVGTATITAKTTDGSNLSASAKVVVQPLLVETMAFADPQVSVVKTKDKTITLTLNSAEVDNKKMVWTSSDNNVATVVQNLNASYPLEAIVTGQKVGKAIIKAEAQDGSGISATCEVEVTPLQVSDITSQTLSVVKTIPTEMKMEFIPAAADNQKLKWTSLTPDVATVTEDGMVTGLKLGTAQLKATTTDGSNIEKTFEVEVTALSVSSITLAKDYSIVKTEKGKLEYSVYPIASDNQTLKWSSSAPTIASVDETSGVITANKVGNAVITATATDGSGISASTTIHVTPLKVNKVTLSNETVNVLWSTTETLAATVTPELADNKTLKWTSDDENIATVTQKGVVQGVNVGSANITATTTDGSNVSAICKVTVTPVTINLSTKTINLRKGDSYAEQMVNVLPENYEHRDVTWSSSDESVASVNADGAITAVKPGITTIKYVLDYDNNISSECKVIVYDENVVYVGGIYYILDKDSKEATVTSIYGGKNTSLDATKVAQYYSGTINIPETIIYDGDKYTVKKVGSYAFNCQNELQSIIVPRTVTMIQDNAAIHAENLNRVNVANESQLVSIGKRAFMECTGLKRFTFDGTSLFMDIIDKEAFKNCTALERVTWTDDTSIKTIGYGVFYGCSALEKVQWMKKSELKTIQDYAFFKCVSLNNFEMPNTTLSVGNSSFRYNSGLTNIHLSTSLNYIDEYAFGECGFSQITLPESLANIQAGAFINNEHLQEITLPEKLQGLGSAAFENNSALESVTFKTAIETMTIGNNAFNQCPILNKVYITNLNSFAQTNFNNAKANPANTSQHIYDANGKEIINVVLPKGTKYVNNNAFNGCAYIKSIEMPATMDHINDDIFYGCSALKDVYCYAEDVPDFIGVNDPSSMDAVFEQATLHVPFGSEEKYQKDTEWWGRFGSIQGCDPQPTQVVEKIDLSTRTVNLKKGTTYNEQKITVTPAEAANVRIKYSTADRNVADIDEDGVIHGVAAGVTTITYTANDGSGVTAECKVIVREPEVEYVGDLYYLFDKGKKQATVTSIYGGKNTSLDAEKVAQYYTGTVNIPEQTTFDAVTYDVKAIGGYAFTCQNDLQALRVGAFVEEIADNAATKAINLNRITVANASQLKNIGKEAFMDCVGLQHVLFEGTTQNMEAINEAAFKNCTALQDVIWEGKSTLNLIGNSAFYGCSKLETVKWNDLCTLQVIDDYAFYQCSSLNHFIMPNSTLSVGKYSFRYDGALTDILLSTSLSIIYDYAFGECGFTQIVLPESLKSLQAGAFINNSYLADITIPKKLEGIGAGAFENNDALETVTFKTHETKLTVDKNAFNYCPVLSKVNIDYLDDWAHINFQNAAANPASTAHRLYLNNVEIIDVNLPSGTKYIGNNVFNGCSNIRTLTVPATVEHINDNIIYGCSALRDVYCYAAKVPQFIGTEDASAMSDVFNQATLHVIYGNEAAYKADSWWGRFYKVEGCNAPSDTDVKVSSITISQTEATLKPDDTMQLEATVYPTNAANKKINWSSSNEDVAQVTEDGFVLAITEGEADITAEAADGSGIKAVCHITVENEKKPVVPIVEIKFEQSPVTIALGESFKLNVIFNPANASNKQLTWTTSRSAVATVDREGNVYGVTEGKAIITAKTTDGSNLTINCVVTVSKTTGIGNITMGDVKMILDKHHLKVEGLADNDIVQIVNTIGFTVYKGTEHEVDLDAPGIYIIKVKGKTLKFSVK